MVGKKKFFVQVFLVSFSLILVLQWLSHHRLSTNPTDRQKEFLYLIQTENCLPTYLSQQRLLGNSNECKCDVLVLSYKTKCDKQTADHIQYMYGPNTSWSSGRNALYQRAWKRNVNYLYYIFADDDIRLEYKPYVNQSVNHKPELRTFEDFLLDVEPAVGCVDYTFHRSADFMKTIRKCCLNKPDLSLLPMVQFDPILNAFHRDALPYLLPYTEEYDNECWWHSHRIISISIEMKFRGQAVMYPGITVLNTLHRKYPTNMTHEREVISNALDREISEMPEKFRDHFAVTSYMESPVKHSVGICQTTCMDIIPHHPIIPYDHFMENQLIGYKSLGDAFDMTALNAFIQAYLS